MRKKRRRRRNVSLKKRERNSVSTKKRKNISVRKEEKEESYINICMYHVCMYVCTGFQKIKREEKGTKKKMAHGTLTKRLRCG